VSLPAGYTLRAAEPADAGVLAAFRGAMFTDLGAPLEDDWAACWTRYFQAALADGRYWAALAEHQGAVVSGAGLMLLPVVPLPSDPSGLRAQVQGVYTVPTHRGRGLGEALTRAVLREAQARGLCSASLNASVMGRAMYERLGFAEAQAPELRLRLTEVTL
jgi:GNAT superfamily N-acetyltransferase